MKPVLIASLLLLSPVAFAQAPITVDPNGDPNFHSPPVTAATCPGTISSVTPPPDPFTDPTQPTPPETPTLICLGSKVVSTQAPEVQALLVDPVYIRLSKQLTEEAKTKGSSLVVTQYIIRWSGVVEIVEAHVALKKRKFIGGAKLTSIGSIQATVMLDDQDHIVLQDMVYDNGHEPPPVTPPGGASVGNKL